MNTYKINNHQKEYLFKNFVFVKRFLNNKYSFWFSQQKDITMHFYSNFKLLVQGSKSNIANFCAKHPILFKNLDNSFLNKVNKDLSLVDKKKEVQIPYFGGDESGVGDLFGPIVITVVYLNSSLIKATQNLKIKDSKQLNDEYILKLGPILMQHKKNFAFTIINNELFNQQFSLSMNLKELITFYYIKTLDKIVAKYPKTQIIIDGYTMKYLFYKYCKKLSLPIYDLELIEKAENQYLGVAIASIISRFIFLKEIEKIKIYFQKQILLGASNEVKKFIQILAEQHGWKKLEKFVKINYKGVKERN